MAEPEVEKNLVTHLHEDLLGRLDRLELEHAAEACESRSSDS